MTEQEIRDNAPSGATHYWQKEEIIRYHKIENGEDYWFDGRLWRYSAFNQLKIIYTYLNPL